MTLRSLLASSLGACLVAGPLVLTAGPALAADGAGTHRTAAATASSAPAATDDADDPAAEVEAAALPEPKVTVQGLDAFALGGQPTQFELVVENVDFDDVLLEDSVELSVRDTPGNRDLLRIDYLDENDEWKPIDLKSEETDLTVNAVGELPIEAETTTLRLGAPLHLSLEDLFELEGNAEGPLSGMARWATRANDTSSAARKQARSRQGFRSFAAAVAEETEGQLELDARLQQHDTVTDETLQVGDTESVGVTPVAPEVVASNPPDVINAGDSTTLSIKFVNGSGFDYVNDPATYDARLTGVLVAGLLADEEPSDFDPDGPLTDPDHLAVACGPKGGALTPAPPGTSELLEIFGPPAEIALMSLADGQSASFSCRITVAPNAPDGLVLLLPAGIVGPFGYPVAAPTEDFLGGFEVVAGAAAPTNQPAPVPPTLADSGATSGWLATTGAGLLLLGTAFVLFARRLEPIVVVVVEGESIDLH